MVPSLYTESWVIVSHLLWGITAQAASRHEGSDQLNEAI